MVTAASAVAATVTAGETGPRNYRPDALNASCSCCIWRRYPPIGAKTTPPAPVQ